MSKTSEFYQCLICNSFFGSLWKVETHVKSHNEDEKRSREGTTNNGPRRRGMLPIQKRTFYDCYVPVVKNQIDPDFLAKYESVQANDEKAGGRSVRKNRELSRLGVSEDVTEEDILNSSVKRPRRGNLQAKANIRKAAAILTIPDQGDNDDSDKDYIESLLEEDSEDNDDKNDDSSDYDAYFCKKGRQRGRPLGSYTVTKDGKPECKKGRKRGRPLGSYTVTKDRNPEKGRKIGRPLAMYTLTKDRKLEPNHNYKPKRWIWDGKDHPFKCEYCPKSFPKRVIISNHIMSEHKDVAKTIDCPLSICNKTCVSYWSLSDHLRFHGVAEQREVLVKEEILSSYADTDKKPDNEFFRRYGGLVCQYCLLNVGFSLEHLEKHKNTEHGENVILKCPVCEESFQNSVLELISHVKSFHPSFLDPYDERLRRNTEYKEMKPRFKCDKCSYQCKYDYQLKKHIASHDKEEEEGEKRFKCPSCNKGFKYKDNLRRHFMLHLENNPFVCDFANCNRKFNSQHSLRRHKLLHSQSSVEANRVYCPICHQCVSRKDKLARHMKNMHKPEDIVNGIPAATSFVYKRRQVRMPHVGFVQYSKNHKVSKSALTTIANNKAVPSSSSSVSTSEVQEENSIFKSEQIEEIHLIDKILLTENGTAIHIKGEHLSPQKISEKESTNNIKLPRLNCDTVDDTFSIPAKTPLNITQLITNDPIFKTLDPKSAEVKDILTRSRNYHNVTTGSKSFTCTECNAIFTRAWSLQLHLKSIHKKTLDESTAIISRSNEDGTAESAEGERSSQVVTLMCGTCAYVAKDSKDLQNHMETSHNYGLTHRCNICGIHLRDKQRLQRHIKEVHMGPRNHLCKYCKKGFASSSKRRTHEFTQHEQPPQERKQCPICHKHFSHRSIVAHIKIHKTKSAKEMEKLKCQLCQDVFSCRASLKRHIDCVHLGKPFNIIHHRKYAAKRRPELKSRAPEEQAKKTKGDGEWFRPLLDKVEELPTRKLKPDEPIPKEASEDSALSILGF
ncbi:unnamed protein product [Orchesella dallaii]|uniref:C2H2-type domain-containing protein n=1 Tax=Orchesella dallaii TaxID=48710 RepID=A0ABP1RCC6_9HEXA